MQTLAQDVRYAMRAFITHPGFTLAAVLSIALGVGANSAIFSVASALLLHSLPYHDPDRLVILWNRSPGLGITEDWFSTAQYFDIKTGHPGFEQIAIAIGGNYNLTGDGEPERVGTIRVSSNLLPMLGARAAAGHGVRSRFSDRLFWLRSTESYGEVLLFTLSLCLFSGILFGFAPALRLCRLDLNRNLKDAGRGSAGTSAVWGRGQNVRRLLVLSELALSVMLLIGAGLLIRSFARLQQVPPGFNAAHTLTLELTMSGRKCNDAAAVLETYRQLWSRLQQLPGVTAAGGVSALPLSQMMSWGPVTVEGRTPPPGKKFINADQRIAGGHYFRPWRFPYCGDGCSASRTCERPRASRSSTS